MRSTFTIVAVAATAFLTSSPALAQINFEKTGYYLSLGDSIAAGEGALPVTHGFVYELYDHGAFGRTQELRDRDSSGCVRRTLYRGTRRDH